MIPRSENAHYATGANSHMGDIRVLLIVASDSQEVCIHRVYVSTTGFGEHGPQSFEPLCVPFEREQLDTVTIKQTGLRSENMRHGLTKGLTFPLLPSRALR